MFKIIFFKFFALMSPLSFLNNNYLIIICTHPINTLPKKKKKKLTQWDDKLLYRYVIYC